MHSSRIIILLLISISLLTAISIDIYLPSMPAIADYFSSKYSEVQLSMSVFLVGFAAMQLVCGPLSDRFGRRPVLLGGLILYFFGTALGGLAGTLSLLIFARFIQAVGACTGPLTAYAIAKDLFQRQELARILAYISTAMSISPVLAPLLGSYLQHWLGWRSSFIFLALLDIAILLSIWFKLPETNKQLNTLAIYPRILIKNYLNILSNGQYQIFAFCLICGFSALFSFIINSPSLLINRIQIPITDFGYIFAMNSLALIVGGLVTTRLTVYMRLEKIIIIRSGIILLGGLIMLGLALTFPISIKTFIWPMIISSFGIAMIVPTTIACAISLFFEKAGAASAMINCLRYFGAAMISYLVGYFHGKNQFSLALTITTCAILMLISMEIQKKLAHRSLAISEVGVE